MTHNTEIKPSSKEDLDFIRNRARRVLRQTEPTQIGSGEKSSEARKERSAA